MIYKQKGIATIVLMIAIPVLCVVMSYAAAKVFGPTSEITKDVEEFTEDEIEDELHAPRGSLKDKISKLFPHNEA